MEGVFVKVLSGILNHYHTQANMDMFMASKNERHLTDLAGLQGARLVTATETERGRQWAEARIKTLTGEDKIRARFMRQDEFTYEATYKLFMIGNTPRFEAGVYDVMRRRLQMIPLTWSKRSWQSPTTSVSATSSWRVATFSSSS